MPSLDEISINLEGIGHALSDNMLAVPIYQRSYAWEEIHVLELFQDIATAISEQEKEYFIGSIVISQHSSDRPEVVDGQQRLATASILIAAVRDWFHKQGDTNRTDDIDREFLSVRDLRTQERVARLRLNEGDHDYFLRTILSPPDSPDRALDAQRESHRKIAKAAELAQKHVRTIVEMTNRPVDRLIDWIEYLRSGVRVIWVKVPDHANAFTIFETLNDRGLDLAISDLLKNYLFHLADDRITEVQQRWVSMFSALDAADNEKIVVDYIRHLWSSKNGLTREKDLYDKIRRKITSKQGAIDFASELEANSKLYASLLNTDHESWSDYGATTRFHMATINLLRMVQVRPLLLGILSKFPVNEVRKALKLMVSWSVRFLIYGGVGGGTLEKHYSARAMQIWDGSITTAKALLDAMRHVVPTDNQFEGAFSNASVSKNYLARYYLRALENQERGAPSPELIPNPNEEVVSLEHVLPENPSPAWAHINEETSKAYHKRIGNLSLIQASINMEAGNDGFDIKKPLLSNSEFKLTSAIADYAQWGPNEIESRQNHLAKLAVKAWPNSL